MQRKFLFTSVAAALGLAGAFACAASGGLFTHAAVPVAGADAFAAPAFVAGSDARVAFQPHAAARTGGVNTLGAVSAADVGDVDSFGRNVRWLGFKSAVFGVSTDCRAWSDGDPTLPCTQIRPGYNYASFRFNDLLRIQLPGGAANSLLCHWLSDQHQIVFADNTGRNAQPGQVRYSYFATLDSPILQDPSLIDPGTGQPFNGSLTTGSLLYEDKPYVVLPNTPTTTYESSRSICRGGTVSKQILIENYGFTPALADKFMALPITVHLNASGVVSYVTEATFSVGLRLVGD